MKNRMTFLPVLIFFLTFASARGQEYFAPKNILNFADYLYQQHEYVRAAVEYQRYLTTVAPNDSVLYALGLSYKKAKKLSAAEAAFQQIPARFRGSLLISKVYLQTGFLWVVKGESEKISSFQRSRLRTIHPQRMRQALQTLFGVRLLLSNQFSQAQAYYKKLDDPDFSKTERPFVKAFQKLALSGERIKRKKPILAGALSAVIPGLGRFYAGRPGDGLYSLVFIGISGYSAYRGFSRNGLRSGWGWVLGGLTTALYLGNVYGSYLTAKIVNQKRKHDLRTQVVLQLDLWQSAHHLDAFLR